jgi:hypothetical protein
VDKQAELIASMRSHEQASRQSMTTLSGSAAFAQREVVRLAEALDARDREIASLKRQLEVEQARSREVSEVAMAARQELVAAADDLSAMTRENQVRRSAVQPRCRRLRCDSPRGGDLCGLFSARADTSDHFCGGGAFARGSCGAASRGAHRRVPHRVAAVPPGRAGGRQGPCVATVHAVEGETALLTSR